MKAPGRPYARFAEPHVPFHTELVLLQGSEQLYYWLGMIGLDVKCPGTIGLRVLGPIAPA